MRLFIASIARYCHFSYEGTWEWVNLFGGTTKFSYHICYENIGQKYNKILWSQETDRPWTERTEQENHKECQNLGNLLIKLTVKTSSEKAWLLYEFPFSLNLGGKPNDTQAWKNYSSLYRVSTEGQFQANSKKIWWDILEAAK